MGGGKGGGGPVYSPHATNALESTITGMGLGQALASNPNLGDLLKTPGIAEQLKSLGIDPNNLASLAPKTSQVDYKGLLDMAGGLNPNSATPTTTAGSTTAPFKFSTPTQAYQFNQPGYQATNFQAKDISGIPDDIYKQQRQQSAEDISRQTNQAQQQATRAYSKTGFGKSAPGGVQADIARQGNEASATANRAIDANQAATAVDVGKFNANQGFAAQQAQTQQSQFQTQLDQWRQGQQAAATQGNQNLNLQTEQAQAGQNLSADQLKLAGENQAFTQNLNSGASDFDALMKKIGLMGSLQQQQQQQSNAPFDQLMKLYSANIGIPAGPGGGKGDPFSAILGAGANVATAFA